LFPDESRKIPPGKYRETPWKQGDLRLWTALQEEVVLPARGGSFVQRFQ